MSLKLYKRGEVYWYRGTVAGRRLHNSTGTSDLKTAQRIAAEREARQWKGHLDGPEAVLTFSQAAILYLQAEKPHRYIDTVAAYWKDALVKGITGEAVRQAAIVLLPNAKPATRNRQVIVPTQAIINHAAALGQCKHLRVDRFPVVKKQKPYVTKEWADAFVAHATPHLGALALFMLGTGARITEALNLRWADVDLQARRAVIRMGKLGGEERRPHLSPPLVSALANIPSNREGDEKVFRFSSRDTAKLSWRAAIRRARISGLTFHACRHGFATGLLHRGVDPITVAKLGGWKDAKHVFETYGHPMDDDTLADRIFGPDGPNLHHRPVLLEITGKKQ